MIYLLVCKVHNERKLMSVFVFVHVCLCVCNGNMGLINSLKAADKLEITH